MHFLIMADWGSTTKKQQLKHDRKESIETLDYLACDFRDLPFASGACAISISAIHRRRHANTKTVRRVVTDRIENHAFDRLEGLANPLVNFCFQGVDVVFVLALLIQPGQSPVLDPAHHMWVEPASHLLFLCEYQKNIRKRSPVATTQ